MLISDFVNFFYKDLETLFTNFKLRNEKVEQFYINLVTIVKPFGNTIGI